MADRTTSPAEPVPPLTAVVRRRIRNGEERAFEATMREFATWALACPGHRGLVVLRPPPGGSDYTVVAHFADAEARRAFTGTPEYAAWMARLAATTDGVPTVREVTGLEGFVTLPGESLARPGRLRLAAATLLGVYPTSTALGLWLAPHLTAWPPWLRGLAFAAAMVACLTWLVMPVVTRLLHSWLHPETRATELP